VSANILSIQQLIFTTADLFFFFLFIVTSLAIMISRQTTFVKPSNNVRQYSWGLFAEHFLIQPLFYHNCPYQNMSEPYSNTLFPCPLSHRIQLIQEKKPVQLKF
jgi:hypothetical protein